MKVEDQLDIVLNELRKINAILNGLLDAETRRNSLSLNNGMVFTAIQPAPTSCQPAPLYNQPVCAGGTAVYTVPVK